MLANPQESPDVIGTSEIERMVVLLDKPPSLPRERRLIREIRIDIGRLEHVTDLSEHDSDEVLAHDLTSLLADQVRDVRVTSRA